MTALLRSHRPAPAGVPRGEAEIPQGNAQKNAADFLGIKQDELRHDGDTEGNLATYNFSGETQRITVSRLGGYVVSLIDSREIGAETLSQEDALAAGAAFLESRGIDSMKEAITSSATAYAPSTTLMNRTA